MKSNYPHDPSSGVLEPVTWIEAPKPDSKVRVVLPGSAQQIAGRLITEVTAAALLVVPDGRRETTRSVLLRFAADPFDLARSDAEVAAKLHRDPAPVGFELKVEAEHVTCGDLLRPSACDASGPGAPLAVTLQQGFLFAGKKRLVSAPIRGFATVTPDPFPWSEPDDALPFLFDCHSHWYAQRRTGRPTRYWTICHGSCPASNCHCASSGGRTSRACQGWCFCWC